ncbi:LacI family DNA-binding transcriptional regulator [Sphingobium yanoikuyae]|uniref:LacI family DNA-binding transcriptional regulator n=1 Tax=Sphingobium yanoikuyae TaxID=13690 RepID=UPI0009BE5B80|nr:LacI family DNA-binding transcriptional regulator [Sphingobium yanoikuyae]MDG2515690.1 LacI family DNA-binding transcriptional regulator [Sphingobium yanoikuyae]
MTGRGPTSHDVARAAGVSQSAVSRAFTPGASVSPEMRARIEKVAAMLGYRPSRLPGIMRRGKSGIVAVVVGGFYNPFHTMTLESFTRALTSAGRQVMLVQVESDRDLDEAVGDLVALNIDGVVSALSISSPEVAAVLDRHRLPIVTLNSAIESEWVRAVNSDNKETGRQAARTLHASGSQEFASVMGPIDTLSHSARPEGFTEVLRKLGIVKVEALHGGYDYGWGREAGSLLLAQPRRPDGVFCGNDLIAAGIIDLWAEHGLHAPDDFRIIGCDNIPFAAWPAYDLTSFDQRSDDMASFAIDALCRTDAAPLKRMIVPTALVRRSSC